VTARDRIVLMVVVAVAAVAGCWLLVISPKRKQASSLGAQVTSLQSQLSTARGTVAKGLAARGAFAGDYEQLAKLGEALPQDDNVPSLIVQLQNAAAAAHVDFRSLQLTPAAAGSSPTPSTSSTTPGSTGTSTTSTAPLPPGAALGTAGFPTEQFTFSFTGNFFHLSDFFGRLQRFVVASKNHITVSGRLLSLNAISLAEGPKGFPQITATVSATTYMAPASTGLTDGATAAGPAGTPAAAASRGTSSSTTPAAAPATITPSIR
jgi:type II secretory pathway pseudopilin PulG